MDYYEFRSRSEKLEELKQAKRQILMARLKLKPIKKASQEPEQIALPHQGQKPTMLRISATDSRYGRESIDLQFRPAYFDLLSLSPGHMPNSSLSMMDLSLRIQDDNLLVDKLDLLNIETLNISPTNLPGDGGMAWSLRTGFERNRLLAQKDSLGAFVQGGVGKGIDVDNWVFYSMAELRWQQADVLSRQLLALPRLGFTYEYDQFKLHCNASYPIAIDAAQRPKRAKYLCETRIVADSEFDIRFAFSKYLDQQIRLSLSIYF